MKSEMQCKVLIGMTIIRKTCGWKTVTYQNMKADCEYVTKLRKETYQFAKSLKYNRISDHNKMQNFHDSA